jgi:hypothetical protein
MKTIPALNFFPRKKEWFSTLVVLINSRTTGFFNRFSQARSQEFQYSFLEKLVFNIIIFDKIIKFEYIFSSL